MYLYIYIYIGLYMYRSAYVQIDDSWACRYDRCVKRHVYVWKGIYKTDLWLSVSSCIGSSWAVGYDNCVKRHVFVWKETYRRVLLTLSDIECCSNETFMYEKRPRKETYIYEKRPTKDSKWLSLSCSAGGSWASGYDRNVKRDLNVQKET